MHIDPQNPSTASQALPSSPAGWRRGPAGPPLALTPRTMQALLIHSRFPLAALLVPAWKGIVVRGLEDPQQCPHSSPDLSPQQTSLDGFADGGPAVPPQQGPFPHRSPTSSGAAVGFGLSWHRHVVSQSSQPLPCCPGTDPGWRESSLLVPELTHFQPSASQDLSPTVSRPWCSFWALWASGFCFCRL